MKRFIGALAIAAAITTPAMAQEFKPTNPECIAPASPGGGWDFICRTVSKLFNDLNLADSAIQVTNMTGGGGGVAYAHVVAKRNEDDNLIVAASNGTTTRLAQDAYPGNTENDVRWLASFGAEYGVIAVAADSEIDDLKELVEQVKADPRSVAFAGGSAVGGYDHLKVLKLAKAAGVDDVRQIKYVAFSGGGEAMAQVLGGSIQAFTGDFSEVRGFVEAGDIRIVAVLAPKRLENFNQFPTAVEQGYAVTGPNWRGLYVPKGMSDEAYAYWSEAVQKMVASPEWEKIRSDAGIEPLDYFGEDVAAFVEGNVSEIRALSKEIGLIK
ncbi:Bug family tripartite tricarboxylate transporter substrate binding protein [Thalassospira povalilytica]|uniref:Bug family tripartite tricarboxylate transporter substrate binding protein n=1 Tax=Thalassospira povalilytica TaxID=732237 RepID=UPI001D190F0F|nr:tripartite tricarboxylate transporter substrate-binding protein [Thalassospira povalilytica]MCC4242103.1 tripartite tricarboxylate transporter substrate binding protein [Thalassospira povalilytica]